jgi:hypothetical protein
MRDRELTADEYKEKLKQVEKDIETSNSKGEARKFEALTQYKEYLEEELAEILKNEKTSKHG